MRITEQYLSRYSHAQVLRRLTGWLRLEVADGDPSPATLRSYLSSAKMYLQWCEAANLDAKKVSKDGLKQYRRYLIGCGYSRGTIATKLSGIKRLYDAMKSWGWRKDNPAEGIKAKRELTTQSERIIAKYIKNRDSFLGLYLLPKADTVAGKRDRAILRILCYTGLRVSELCSLDRKDLDLGDAPSLTVRAGKGRKRRHIPLGEDDRSILREWLDARGRIQRSTTTALFVSLDNRSGGSRLSPRGARGIVDKYLEMANLKKPGRSCHALRHSTATWLLAAGVPMEVIADLLGHSSVSVTAIYAKVVDHRKYTPSEMLSRAIRELAGLYLPGVQEMGCATWS